MVPRETPKRASFDPKNVISRFSKFDLCRGTRGSQPQFAEGNAIVSIKRRLPGTSLIFRGSRRNYSAIVAQQLNIMIVLVDVSAPKKNIQRPPPPKQKSLICRQHPPDPSAPPPPGKSPPLLEIFNKKPIPPPPAPRRVPLPLPKQKKYEMLHNYCATIVGRVIAQAFFSHGASEISSVTQRHLAQFSVFWGKFSVILGQFPERISGYKTPGQNTHLTNIASLPATPFYSDSNTPPYTHFFFENLDLNVALDKFSDRDAITFTASVTNICFPCRVTGQISIDSGVANLKALTL